MATRINLEKALAKCKQGRNLSRSLGWGFTDEEITELAKLHKANKYCDKIEDLLEDCNFHYENSKFKAHDYSEFIK
jgi:hypothetical protein